MFKCKVCAEKDKRIADLKYQIGYLKALITPSNDPNNIPVTHLEADGVLSGQQHVITVPDHKDLDEELGFKQAETERAERDALLSGSYDQLQV